MMKKNIFFALSALMLFSCSDDENFSQPGIHVIKDAAEAPIQPEGFYVLNEGWFGHDAGSMSYFKKNGENYDITYWAYAKANANETLGVTSCYATPWAGDYYIVSKDDKHLVVADETTLKKEFSYTNKERGKQAYSFVGVDDQKGYLGFDKGLYVYNIATKTVEKPVEGINEGIGIMAYSQGKVFISSPKKLYVVNPTTDNVDLTKEMTGKIYSLTLDNEGNVIVATEKQLFKINPVSMEQTEIAYPDGAKVEDPWGFAWNPGSLCASLTKNNIYWTSKNSVYKTNVSTGLSEKIYTLGKSATGEKLSFYGAGLRVDPMTDELILLVKHDGWGENGMYNYLYKLDADGKEICHFKVLNDEGTGYYWFPSMPVFADANKPQILLKKVEMNQIPATEIDLKEVVIDYDNLFTSMIFSLESGDDSIVKASILNGKLILKATETKGTTECTLNVISNGVKVSKAIEIVNQ